MNRIIGAESCSAMWTPWAALVAPGRPGNEADPRPSGELPLGQRHHRGARLLPAHGHLDRRVDHGVERGEIGFAGDAVDPLDPLHDELVDEDLPAGAGRGTGHGRAWNPDLARGVTLGVAGWWEQRLRTARARRRARRSGAGASPCAGRSLRPCSGRHGPTRRTPGRRIRRACESERTFARNFSAHRRIVPHDRRARRLAAPVAHAADLAVARLRSQRDAGSRGARAHLRARTRAQGGFRPSRACASLSTRCWSSAISAGRTARGSTPGSGGGRGRRFRRRARRDDQHLVGAHPRRRDRADDKVRPVASSTSNSCGSSLKRRWRSWSPRTARSKIA